MFCRYCGRQIGEEANFCPHCGRGLKAPAALPVQTAVPVRTLAPVQRKPVNGLGIAAFVIGLVSFIFGFYVFFIAIAGIVLGAIGVAQRNKYRLNGLAIAGLVISCVTFVFWFFVRIIAFEILYGFFYLLFLPFMV